MKVIRIAMIRPNSLGIYAPSRMKGDVIEKDLSFYYQTTIEVSFEPDGFSNPHPTTAWGRGLDCWYIAADGNQENSEIVLTSAGFSFVKGSAQQADRADRRTVTKSTKPTAGRLIGRALGGWVALEMRQNDKSLL